MATMRTFPIFGAVDRVCLPKSSTLDVARKLADDFAPARVRRVQVLRSPSLDRRADPNGQTRIWLAMEHLQVTGSFKVRGALLSIARAKEAGIRSVVAASAGNHGAGVAYAANILGVHATVVVPHTAPVIKRDKITAHGARVVISESAHYDGAEAEAKALARETGALYLSPYDNVDVILGNGASIGFEIVTALGGVPDRIIAPFGGGGLTSGLAWAICDTADDAHERRVWGVQSEASPVMSMSLERGSAIETLESEPTLAEGLEGGISKAAFARARGVLAGVVVVEETMIAASMRYAQKELEATLEGSAAIALAPVLAGLPEGMRGGDVVVVLTGQNVDKERLDAIAV
jgi:threonine dehydratase